MKVLLLTVYFFLVFAFWQPSVLAKHDAYIDTALTYVHVRETGNNDGKEVRMFLKSVGLGKGYSWCAAFISYCLKVTASKFPVRSAVARKFITKHSIKAQDVLLGKYTPKRGDLIIWQRGETPYGHIAGNVKTIARNLFQSIEGNTSSGAKGNQHDGNGVYIRLRSIQPSNYFRITHFTPVHV